jgi:uncharacterized protein YidB (DUF937 family)
MGLLDVLNGMQNGPHGQSTPGKGGGMSPLTMALLGLIAYKAVKSLSGSGSGTAPPAPGPSAGVQSGGGLGDLLHSGLGGLLGGGGGSVLSEGLNDVLKQFQQAGHGDAVNSWVGAGPNKAIAPNDLAGALGADRINSLTTLTGMSRDDLLKGLSQLLPGVVDQLTPNGRVPTPQEAGHLI